MEIHRPKQWHSIREFFKEYAIIVVGVLTALVAEQAVEALRHRAEAAEAQEAIRAEVIADITRIEQRSFAEGCVEARLVKIEQIIDAAAPDGRIVGPSWIGRPPRYAVESARRDAASQSGRVSLLPTDWQSRFGLLYTGLRYYYEMNNAEQQTRSRLGGLAGQDRLTPDGRLLIKAEIEQARFYNYSMRQVARLLLNRAASEGLRPTNRRDPQSSVCWPITTPTAEGLARTAKTFAGRRSPDLGTPSTSDARQIW